MVLLLKALSHLPLGILYALSDLLAWVAADIVKYRRAVVLLNLTRSFPEKSQAEINLIARKFYVHLADVIVESIKAISISTGELERRVKFIDSQVPENFKGQYSRIIVLTMHTGNWEWMSLASCIRYDFPFHPLYLPLTSKPVDRLMLQTRSRLGAEPLPSFTSLFKALSTTHEFKAGAILADQTPPAHANKYWAQFLHQDTAFLPGIEKLPRRLECPVIFMWSVRVKRGFYEVHYETLGYPPFPESDGDSLMQAYIQVAERVIRRNPEQWLWSHRRWKHSRLG